MADDNTREARLLAAALYDIRILLGPPVVDGDVTQVTEAAAISYALHNEALAFLEHGTFDLEAAFSRLEGVDRRLGIHTVERLRFHLENT